MDNWKGKEYDDDDGGWDRLGAEPRLPRKRDLSGNIIDGAYADGKTRVSSKTYPRDAQAAEIKLLKANNRYQADKVSRLQEQLGTLQAAADEVNAINRMLRTTNSVLVGRNEQLTNVITVLREIHNA